MPGRRPKLGVTPGLAGDYNMDETRVTPEAAEFGRAMDRYKRRWRRPYPTYAEALAVLKSLGYRKQGGP